MALNPPTSRLGRLQDVLARFAQRRLQELLGMVILLSTSLWVVALVTYSPYDTTRNQISNAAVDNWLGGAGAQLADTSFQIFGAAIWAAVPGLLALGTRRLLARPPRAYWRRLGAWVCATPLLALAIALVPHNPADTQMLMTQTAQVGGFVGQILARAIQGLWLEGGTAPSYLLSWARYGMVLGLGGLAVWLALYAAGWIRLGWQIARAGLQLLWRASRWIARELFGLVPSAHSKSAVEQKPPKLLDTKAPAISPKPMAQPIMKTRKERPTPAQHIETTREAFILPPVSLLKRPATTGARVQESDLQSNAQRLEAVLAEFSIEGRILKVRAGPVVTLYEFEPAAGIRTARIVGLADDIARSMKATSCRVAVVAGQNVIGIELPNIKREIVSLRELISSQEFQDGSGTLALGLGKNIAGAPFIADLMQMPHLLVAGTTGAGKSVGINTMILSLLYRLTPEQCRLILVDPKILELSVYEGIPHLLAPVVTEPKKAVFALKWAIREMEQRYRKMSQLGVRNIQEYNASIAKARAKGTPLLIKNNETDDSTQSAPTELPLVDLPFIVIIIDEMADLMAVAGKEIEGAVQRLAQMARAAGLHLITATQRPSVDVITGTIKANFPSRISFQVTSKIDSRTILGEQGGEQLLGKGDMLVMSGGARIQRVHGAFVSDDEVKRVVTFLKNQRGADYTIAESITRPPDDDPSAGGATAGEADPLYAQAVDAVLSDNRPSISFVQRRLQIGYNRAARLIEEMEKNGIISPANAAGKRDILDP